jgi:aryl-alcohol dehydrogenase-like predicted oxidoreductase
VAWVLQNENVASIIGGPTAEQGADNVAAP